MEGDLYVQEKNGKIQNLVLFAMRFDLSSYIHQKFCILLAANTNCLASLFS